MAEETALNPTEYIQHHLTFLASPVADGGGFWVLQWDTLITTLALGALTLGVMWIITRKATSGPPSHRVRRYANMCASEIIFVLLGLWAATGVAGVVLGSILRLCLAIFHILIVVVQAYIFMMLTIVYVSMAAEQH